jgi:hypothetical protein
MNNKHFIPLWSILRHADYQSPAALDEDAIAYYANEIRQAGRWPFPSIKILRQIPVGSYHQIEAARRVCLSHETSEDLCDALWEIPCERLADDLDFSDLRNTALAHELIAYQVHNTKSSGTDTSRSPSKCVATHPNVSSFDSRWAIISDLILDAYYLGFRMITGAMMAKNRKKVKDE